MKRLSIFTILFLLYGLVIINTNITAQNNSIRISPSFITYKAAPSENQEETIIIENNTTQLMEFIVRGVFISEDPKTLIIDEDQSKLQGVFTLEQEEISIEPGKNEIIKVILNISDQALSEPNTPALQFLPKKEDPEDVSVSQSYLIPVQLSFDIETPFNIEVGVTTTPNIIVSTDPFFLVGSVVNRQNREFKPTGRFELYNGEKLLKAIPVTDQLPDELKKDRVESFVEIFDGQDILEPYRSYEVKLFLQDTLTGKEFSTSYSTIYIPKETILAIIGVIILLLIILVYIYRNRRIKNAKTKTS